VLGMEGWFSTNILGNRDGEVLDDPANFKTKEVSKLSVLEQILEPERYPELYKDLQHKVSIHYYKPRGDNKEGWDNIDIVGWMGYPMQIKVNFLCRDSILAAPIVLDLALFGDLAARGWHGVALVLAGAGARADAACLRGRGRRGEARAAHAGAAARAGAQERSAHGAGAGAGGRRPGETRRGVLGHTLSDDQRHVL